MDILIPISISLVPGLIVLSLVCRMDLRLWIAAALGGGGWLIALILRQPLLLMLTGVPLYLYIASFMAGLFEELTRFLLLKLWLAGSQLKRAVMSLGLGWGITEALVIYVIPAYLTYIITRISWIDFIPGAIERNSAILLHLSMTLLLSIKLGDLGVLALAIVLHTLINSLAVITLQLLSNVWYVELVIALTSLTVFTPIYMRALKHKST